jgi:hypothetical protein
VAYLDEASGSWGSEVFSVSIHPGGRTIRCVSELDGMGMGILRDTNWTLDNAWRPREGFARVTIHGELEGHSWFRLDGSVVECEAFTREFGRISQRREVGEPIDFLGLHALTGDALISAVRGLDAPGTERRVTCVTNSIAGYGEKGLVAVILHPLVTYVGRERITVLAGEFEAERFVVRWSDTVPKPAHFWVLAPDFIPLRFYGASHPVSYELESLEQS